MFSCVWPSVLGEMNVPVLHTIFTGLLGIGVLLVSAVVQKMLVLTKVPTVHFCFSPKPQQSYLEKKLVRPMSRKLLSSCRIFMVVCPEVINLS